MKRGDLTVIVTATGTLQPTNKVDVGSELSGIIKSVEVDYNDRVKVGQVLARLDTSKLEAQVTQSRAALESAKAKVLQVQATVTETRSKLTQFQKVRELSNNKVPSQSELDAAEAAFERAKADEASAKAAVSQAQATLEANETDLSKSVIRSPINGVVLAPQHRARTDRGRVLYGPGAVHPGRGLDQDGTARECGRGRYRQSAGKAKKPRSALPPTRIELSRHGSPRPVIGSSTTSGVVTYETVLKVNNSDLSLRPGMTATADITVKKVENAILIPSAALRFTPPVQEEKRRRRSLPAAWSAPCFRVRPVPRPNSARTLPPTKSSSASGH